MALAWTASATGSALGALLGGWGAPAPCRCLCEASSDPALVGLLQRQLDRCGPERLVCPPPTPCECGGGTGPLGWALTFLAGVAVALLGSVWVGRRVDGIPAPKPKHIGDQLIEYVAAIFRRRRLP